MKTCSRYQTSVSWIFWNSLRFCFTSIKYRNRSKLSAVGFSFTLPGKLPRTSNLMRNGGQKRNHNTCMTFWWDRMTSVWIEKGQLFWTNSFTTFLSDVVYINTQTYTATNVHAQVHACVHTYMHTSYIYTCIIDSHMSALLRANVHP